MMPDPENLGHLRDTYQEASPFTTAIGCGTGIALLSTLIVLIAIVTGAPRDELFFLCGFLILPLLGSASAAIIQAHLSRQFLFIYDCGLIQGTQKRGSCQSREIVYWHEVQELRHTVRVEGSSEDTYSIIHTFTLTRTNGTSLNLDLIKRKSWSFIETETSRYLFREILNTYQVSHTAVFGDLVVTSQGLKYNGRNLLPLRYDAQNPLPWSEVKSIEIIDDRVIIRDQEKRFPRPLPWVSVKMSSNIQVFGMLVEYISPGVLR